MSDKNYMTLCERCAERMDAEKHPENKYYLDPVPGSGRMTACSRCFQVLPCTQYEFESKAIRAMKRAITRKKESGYRPKHDTRARYREPWRER